MNLHTPRRRATLARTPKQKRLWQAGAASGVCATTYIVQAAGVAVTIAQPRPPRKRKARFECSNLIEHAFYGTLMGHTKTAARGKPSAVRAPSKEATVSSITQSPDSRQDNVIHFPGFEPPEQNYSKLPHALIDALPQFKTHGELAVVLYILRHTWGFSEYDTPKRISLDEFVNGRKRKDSTRLDGGCGMSLASVKRALKAAEEHGFIMSETDDSDPGRIAKSYKLNMAHAQNEPTLVQDEQTPVQNEPTLTHTPVQNEPSYIERNLEKDTRERKLPAPADADAVKATPAEVDIAIYGPVEKPKRKPNKNEPWYNALLLAFGLDKDKMTKQASGMYWKAAADIAPVVPVEDVPALYEFVKKKAAKGQWPPWTVNALSKYAPEFMASTERKQAAAAIEFPADWYPTLDSYDYTGAKKESA